jgi:2-iminoacetate synthase
VKREIRYVIEKLEQNRVLTPEDACVLLGIDPSRDVELFGQVVAASRRAKSAIFGGKVCPIAPLYVSSICQENCLYCNYRAGNKDKEIERLRLTDEELEREVEFLAGEGIRVIELVYATDPFIDLRKMATHVRKTKEVLARYGGGSVGLNARPLTTDEYRELKKAGLEFVVLWQETFDRERYRELHPGDTEKSDFDYRFYAHERMLEAGIRHIGLGILSGLADWRWDWLELIKRVDVLTRRYEKALGRVILGIPRLKVAAGAEFKASVWTPSDECLLLALAVFNLCFPKALPFVNTRESVDLCVEMAKGGGTLFTFNCTTIPGGYTLGRRGYQFPTYSFSFKEYSSKLQSHGIFPVPNWDCWAAERNEEPAGSTGG